MNRGDIVIVRLPTPASNAGHEQIGNRPALVVHNNKTSSTLSVLMIIPFTSRLNAQRFPHTILVSPSATNGLNRQSVLLIAQLRAIDKRRIEKKIGHLEDPMMELVNRELKNLLGL